MREMYRVMSKGEFIWEKCPESLSEENFLRWVNFSQRNVQGNVQRDCLEGCADSLAGLQSLHPVVMI